MLKLHPFRLNFGGACSLQIRLDVNPTATDILAISYTLKLETKMVTTAHISDVLIEAVSSQLKLKADKHLWDSASLPDLSLAARLQMIFHELGADELSRITGTFHSILFPPGRDQLVIEPVEPNTGSAQVFLAQMACYLTWIDLSYTDILWSILPARLPVPYDNCDARMLTKQAMQCVGYGLKLISVGAHPLLREMSWHLENFLGLWSEIYLVGPKIDTSEMLLEVTSQVLQLGSSRLQAVLKHNAHLRAELQQLQQRLDNLERLFLQGPSIPKENIISL